MNTNALKRFAQEARKKLIEQVSAKLDFVLSTDSAGLREQQVAIDQLHKAIDNASKEQVIEQVAYSWFNRLMALRFMDANDYQLIGISVVTPKPNYTLPELLDEAKQGSIPEELTVDNQKVYDLLDGKIPSPNPQDEVYKLLLIATCNHLHEVFPFLFEKINNYTELLLPDDLTSEFSIVHDICTGMSDEDCQEVEIIGWLYQFYISERKDEVFASKSKVEKEDIPAATQLFTPRWIVEYMVQNTVGKLWLQNRPNSSLREHMPYFIESPSVQNEDFLKIDSVEEITLLDQACGSGHILVYGFELLSKIYEEEGYSTSEIPQLIIEKNLFGFEIDERASQLAGLALMMKARSYHRRFFRKEVKPQILRYEDMNLKVADFNNYQDIFKCKNDKQALAAFMKYGFVLASDVIDESTAKKILKKNTVITDKEYKKLENSEVQEVEFFRDEIRETFRSLKLSLSTELYEDLKCMVQASNLGSLIIPKNGLATFEQLEKDLIQAKSTGDAFTQFQLDELLKSVSQLKLLANKYHCVVDNPPYMGGGNMNKPLADFVKKNYPDSKADLMACFMEAGLKTLKTKGFLGMINQHSWMFLSSYETLREKLIDNTFFDTLLHLGPRTFPEIGGEVVQNASFTFWKTTKEDEKGAYLRLVDYGQSSIKKEKTLEAIQNPNCGWFYTANQKDFEKIPGSPIGYWLSDNIFNIFKNQKTILDISESEGQTKSGNNDKFLRLYWEINKNNFGFANKWVKHPKGGSFRRWYGNLETVINWSEKARKHYRKDRVARILVEKLWWKKGVSWTLITSGKQSFRDYDDESIFNLAAPTLFFNKELNRLYILGLLNTPITETLLKVYNPTLNCNIGEVQSIPLVENLQEELVTKKVENLISCSKQEWNSRETSWDFEQNELLKHRGYDVEESYDLYQQYWKTQFFQLHQNEEELNRQFIEIYGLEDELTPDVPLEDITILKEEAKIVDNQLVFQQGEIFKQFMSYAVGCMFGRYSLDKKGLVLANQGETLADYLEQLANSRVEHPSFTPDADNIIPILDDEWFEDDIVGRFKEFLKVSFGTENYEKNLAFVDECLGGKGIRKYFTKDFYPDHIKRYKKRPIYWMFSSPTGSFNVLIYMHRYTPDTLNKVLNDYLKEYREKLKTELERLEHIKNTGSSREQTLATKDQDRINKVLLELNEYEREVLYPIASQRINIDLDDGVLVNYNKFGKAIKEVKGLNDKAAKAKVKKFDWIDKTSIQ